MLEESKSGPFGMFFPNLKNGFGSLQGAPPGEMKNGILAAGDVRVIEIAGSEAGEMTRGMNLAEDFQGMFAFTENVIDVVEPLDVSLGKSLLIRDEEIESGRAKPAGKDPLEENVGVELLFLPKPIGVKRNAPAVADGDFISSLFRDGVDEIDILIQPDTIGAGDDVEMGSGHGVTTDQSRVSGDDPLCS